jgi:hypothetical protein
MTDDMHRVNRDMGLAAYLAAGAAVSTAAGFALGQAWLLPLVGAAVPFPLFLLRVRQSRYAGAVGWVLLWALFQSVAVGVATWFFPERAAEVIHRGPEYAAEMLGWVRTGEGPEGSPRLYLPIHLRHYLGFCVLSVVTVGAAALALGTWLLNYMNYYVVELVRASADRTTALLLGWPLWAAIRVVGFIVTGTALTALGSSLAAKIRDREAKIRFPVRVFLSGFGLVVADAVLKAVLAPFWQSILFRALGEG